MFHYYKIGIAYYKDLSKKDIISLSSYLTARVDKRHLLEKDFVKVCMKAGFLHMNLAIGDGKKYTYEMIKEVIGEKEFPEVLDKLIIIVVSWLHRTDNHRITQLYEKSGIISYRPNDLSKYVKSTKKPKYLKGAYIEGKNNLWKIT